MTLPRWLRPAGNRRPTAASSVLTAYVLNSGADSDASVIPISLLTRTAGTPISGAGIGSSDIAITPDGTAAYVTSAGDNTVTPVDLAAGRPDSPIPVATGPTDAPGEFGLCAIVIAGQPAVMPGCLPISGFLRRSRVPR